GGRWSAAQRGVGSLQWRQIGWTTSRRSTLLVLPGRQSTTSVSRSPCQRRHAGRAYLPQEIQGGPRARNLQRGQHPAAPTQTAPRRTDSVFSSVLGVPPDHVLLA